MLETEEEVCDGFRGSRRERWVQAAERLTEDESWDQREGASRMHALLQPSPAARAQVWRKGGV